MNTNQKGINMKQKKIAPFTVTASQREWVEKECKRTGETQATVMRRLIQDKINQSEGGK